VLAGQDPLFPPSEFPTERSNVSQFRCACMMPTRGREVQAERPRTHTVYRDSCNCLLDGAARYVWEAAIKSRTRKMWLRIRPPKNNSISR